MFAGLNLHHTNIIEDLLLLLVHLVLELALGGQAVPLLVLLFALVETRELKRLNVQAVQGGVHVARRDHINLQELLVHLVQSLDAYFVLDHARHHPD